MSVITNAAADVNRTRASATVIDDDSVHPCTASTPSRWSRPTATGTISLTAATRLGSATAAEPMTTRVTPTSRRARASSIRRTPPPVCTDARPAAASTIAAITGRLTGSPPLAASRSTTWIHVAPWSQKDVATATASSPYTVSRA
jgi:hypothetical protein